MDFLTGSNSRALTSAASEAAGAATALQEPRHDDQKRLRKRLRVVLPARNQPRESHIPLSFLHPTPEMAQHKKLRDALLLRETLRALQSTEAADGRAHINLFKSIKR